MPARAIYLDNNATTKVDQRVVDAMLPYFTEQFGNPSSMHAFGAKVGGAVKEGRERVQALLGAAHDHEVVFTSGGTESDNAALLSALEANPDRNEIVTSIVEHPAILAMCEHLEKTRGVTVHYIPVDKQGPARPRRLSRCAVGQDSHRLHHVGEQRDRHHQSGSGAGRNDQGARCAVSHGCRAGRRQGAD